MGTGRKRRTDVVAFMHQQRTASNTSHACSCVLPSVSSTLLSLGRLLAIALVVAALLSSITPLRSSVAALLSTVAALLLGARSGVLEGALAGLLVYKKPAAVTSIPLGYPGLFNN
jgi:hypothetical protein